MGFVGSIRDIPVLHAQKRIPFAVTEWNEEPITHCGLKVWLSSCSCSAHISVSAYLTPVGEADFETNSVLFFKDIAHIRITFKKQLITSKSATQTGIWHRSMLNPRNAPQPVSSSLLSWSVRSVGRSLSLYKWRAPFSYVINRAARRRRGDQPKGGLPSTTSFAALVHPFAQLLRCSKRLFRWRNAGFTQPMTPVLFDINWGGGNGQVP